MRTVGETVKLGAGLRLQWRPEGPGDGLPWLLQRSANGDDMWLSEAEGDALIAAFQQESVPVDDLPEGVERISDGWVARGGAAMEALAGSWEYWRNGAWGPITDWGISAGFVYEVRPVPAPEPDMVPWWEAITRQRTHSDGWLIAGCERDADGLWVCSADRSIVARVDPLHGRVACAPLPKDSE